MSVKSGVVWTKERDVLEAKIFFEFWRLKKSVSGDFCSNKNCLGFQIILSIRV